MYDLEFLELGLERLKPEQIKRGVIVQVRPRAGNEMNGMLLIVIRTFDWGIIGVTNVPQPPVGRVPDRDCEDILVMAIGWEECQPVGIARWTPEDDELEEAIDNALATNERVSLRH